MQDENYQAYLRDKLEFEGFQKFIKEVRKKIERLEPLPEKIFLRQKPDIYKIFEEAIELYSFKKYRWSILSSAIIIESLLKDKYSLNNFDASIKRARDEKLLAENDIALIDSLRLMRNHLTHEINTKESTEENAKLYLQICIRVLNKLIPPILPPKEQQKSILFFKQKNDYHYYDKAFNLDDNFYEINFLPMEDSNHWRIEFLFNNTKALNYDTIDNSLLPSVIIFKNTGINTLHFQYSKQFYNEVPKLYKNFIEYKNEPVQVKIMKTGDTISFFVNEIQKKLIFCIKVIDFNRAKMRCWGDGRDFKIRATIKEIENRGKTNQ